MGAVAPHPSSHEQNHTTSSSSTHGSRAAAAALVGCSGAQASAPSCGVTVTRAGAMLPWASSLLWYIGLGGALRGQRSPARAALQPRPGSNSTHAAGAAPGQPPPHKPMSQQGAAAAGSGQAGGKGKQSLASHPLSAQQIEQSMEFSSSSSSEAGAAAAAAASGMAPVQAVAKGLKVRSPLYFGPLGAAALKLGDDMFALLASAPRTLRTLTWALQAGAAYKQLLSGLDPNLDPEGYSQQLSKLHDCWAQRLTEVCRANGGVYVKAGQFAAAFGAVPAEYRKHLALLQDKAKPRPFHVVDRVLRLELGAGAEEVFAEFSAEATAAASLAQVHKARLADGRQVAVKVQYPGLRGAANADLTTLSCLSAAAAALFPEFRLSWLYEELRLKLTEELDFHIELHNAQKLMACLRSGSNTGGNHSSSSSSGLTSSDSASVTSGGSSASSSSGAARDVTVPKPHVALCTSKILTMEWIDGIKVNDTAALRGAKIAPRVVGRVLDDAFAQMTFIHGFIHADPHPGNVMVRPKGRGGLLSWLARGTWQPFEVVLLDHGTYLSIPDRLRQRYCQLWCALFVGDTPGAAAVAIELGGARAGQILPVLLTQRGRTKEEQKQMQRAAGVASFGDMNQLLSTAPRDIVELLRIAAVVRNVTATLGCSLTDRLHCSGMWAFRGLPSYWAGSSSSSGSSGQPQKQQQLEGGEGGSSQQQQQQQQLMSDADRRFAAAGYRLNIRARILVIRSYVALNTAVNRLLLASLHVFGQSVDLIG